MVESTKSNDLDEGGEIPHSAEKTKDKHDHEHTGKDGKDMSFTITFVKPDGG